MQRKFLPKNYPENVKNKVFDLQDFFIIFNNQLLFYNLIVLTLHITFKKGLIEESIFGWSDFYKCHEQNEWCEFCSWWGVVVHAISTPSKGQGQDPWMKKIKFSECRNPYYDRFSVLHINYKRWFSCNIFFFNCFCNTDKLKKI